MIQRLIDLSLRHRAIVLVVYLALGAWGYWALSTASVDAIPDLSDQQVIVFTDWTGHSPQEVEDQVTYPLTVNLQGLPGVRVVRSQSAFGFSMIYVVFQDDVDLYFARTRVLERLALAGRLLPVGAVPALGPDATGVGHVFWYTVESPTRSLRDLRSLQDWFIRYQLTSVPGVAEVASIGGGVKQYQIDVDPNRLRGYNLTLGDVVRAVTESNSNVGGNVVESSGTWSIVRGVGLIERPEDLEQVALRAKDGVPVLVGQVATVKIGDAFRAAALVKGTNEAVGGVIVARAGANAQQVIDGVKARIAEIKSGLPADVSIVPFYDRSSLIARVLGTLRWTLIEEIALVTLAHIVFLMHFRSILIVTLPLPLAVLLSFLAMRYTGVTSNLMSLSGIAIAIGVLVDAGIVVTENAFRHIEQAGIDTRDRPRVLAAVRASVGLVGRPVFFSMAIIVFAFVPVFALTGQEGKLFHPLAFTKTFAVVAATVMAITLVPVLCTLLLRGRLHSEDANPVMRLLRRLYQPVLSWALSHRAATLGLAAALLVAALGAASRLGSEFMPPLDEGDLMFMPIADPSVSLAENTGIAKRQNAALLSFPEVESVVAKVARADTSTDPSPLNMTETVVRLKPRSAWPAGMTMEQLRAEMGRAAQLPGVTNIWTMPIINRIDMLTTGVRSEVGVKVFGADLAVLDRLARDVATALRTVPGAANVYPEPQTSGQYLNIRVDRAAASRYGLTVANIQETIGYAIGETTVGTTIEGRQRFPIRVRLADAFRANPAAIGATPVATPSGASVPLAAVATIEHARGPAMISSENGLLVATVLLNVQGRDVGGFVTDARRAVSSRVAMPQGYFVGWSGRFENQEHARARLRVVIPLALVVIFAVLWLTYRSALEAAHVLLAVPFALTGGLFALFFLHYNFSVAVWVGLIALFGTAVQTAVVMVIYLNEAIARRVRTGVALTRTTVREAVIEGALLRLRPKVMTVSTVIAGLLPIMWSTGPGAEVMRPLAAPVLGGMISSLLHVLIVTPVVFCWLRERRLPREAGAEPVAVEREALRIQPPLSARHVFAAIAILAFILIGWWAVGRGGGSGSPPRTPLYRVQSGSIEVLLFPDQSGLHQGSSTATLEFRSIATGALVKVADVRWAGAMSMPGMAMSSDANIEPGESPGLYHLVASFPMAGVWRLSLTWTSESGAGSVTFDGEVR
jgi:Cu(I)/Ag(I) efflux system membrane protein CusA/SilA